MWPSRHFISLSHKFILCKTGDHSPGHSISELRWEKRPAVPGTQESPQLTLIILRPLQSVLLTTEKSDVDLLRSKALQRFTTTLRINSSRSSLYRLCTTRPGYHLISSLAIPVHSALDTVPRCSLDLPSSFLPLAVPSSWKALPQDGFMICPFALFEFLLTHHVLKEALR